MANSKHSMTREIIIDRLLSNRRGYTVNEMLVIVNRALEFEGFLPVAACTINRDIDTLRYHYRAKIRVVKRSYYNYYMYEDSNYSVFKNAFTGGEILQLHHALMTLRFCDPIQGTMMFEQLSERMADMFEVDSVTDPIVLYKKIPSKIDCKRFSTLYQCIRKKQPISIRYFPSIDKRARETVIHPYFILNDEAKYYLLGHDSVANKPAKIPISNITQMQLLDDTPFIPNSDFPLQDFYMKHFALK